MTAHQPAERPAESRTEDTEASFSIVALAASAGGVHGVAVLLGALGPELSVPVLLVQHLDPRHRTVIAEVLGRRTPLPVKLAEHDERALPGTVYIAPPDRHLLVGADGVLTLSSSALVHFVRPSADLLFESVAGAYGHRAIACVLTGTGRDGAMGVDAVKSRGGTVIAQDPRTAEFSGMPEAAVGTGAVDFVLPLEEIAAIIRGLVEDKRQ
ncbi:chemotaxis protein CheB [Streptomyces alboflavus]|uniref:chemotaxis protein CheB n=1 Tax=Streptomyces alboflavus TaxID=67267 RepID=UPI0036A6B2A0